MTQDNRKRPDIIDLLAMHRCQRNAVPAQRVQRIDLARIRTRLAATDPAQVDQMVEDVEKIRLGLEAFDLAQEYLAAGKLDRARHWLRVAAEYDVEDADILLADVTAIQEAVEGPQTSAITTGTALDGKDTTTKQQERQADVVDELHDVGAVLRRAREQAQTMVRKAQITAGEILAEARSEADEYKAGSIARLVRNFAVHQCGSNDTHLWWGRNIVLEQRLLFSTQLRPYADAARCSAQGNLEQNLARLLLTYSMDAETTRPRWPSWANQVIKRSDTDENMFDNPILSTNCDRVLRKVDLCAAEEAYQAASAFHDRVEAVRKALLDRNDIETIRRWVSSSTTLGRLREEPDYLSVLARPRLWTPQSAARTDDSSPNEQQLEREQIVAGPKFREAIGELNKQVAAGRDLAGIS
jgi:hypothetical protein